MRGPEPTAYLRFPDSELPHDLQRAPLLLFIVLRIELARSVPFFLSFFLISLGVYGTPHATVMHGRKGGIYDIFLIHPVPDIRATVLY